MLVSVGVCRNLIALRRLFAKERALPRRVLNQHAAYSERTSSSPLEPAEIDSMLSKPTWSVRSLLPSTSDTPETPEITPKQLHHLLRLSALPIPESKEEEEKMLQNLSSQLHFVKEIQNVDTTGVEPLRSIRDETREAEKENEIKMEDLKEAFSKEEIIGRSGRLRRRKDLPVDTKGAEHWDVLGQASRKVGRYFVVESGKD
ncbi:MAG: hypothetical protein M1830_009789 [Pleopsidium flavum]|nr:MAG: hypothetical protein M1830_009789 [Pleopsidium flavum]